VVAEANARASSSGSTHCMHRQTLSGALQLPKLGVIPAKAGPQLSAGAGGEMGPCFRRHTRWVWKHRTAGTLLLHRQVQVTRTSAKPASSAENTITVQLVPAMVPKPVSTTWPTPSMVTVSAVIRPVFITAFDWQIG